jgi:hypothetical protein
MLNVKRLMIASIGAMAISSQAYALTDQQVAAINSGVLEAVSTCAVDAASSAGQIQGIASGIMLDSSDAGSIAATMIATAQGATESPSCLFAVGEGLTRWALSFGPDSSTALQVGSVIGQDGEIPVVNACVNIAGVQTDLGIACDPSTGDITGGFERSAPFATSGENPNQDSVSPD